MARSPGFVVPSAYSSKKELEEDVKRRDKAAGYTPFDVDSFAHSDSDEDPYLAQAGAAVDFLAHYGVKGMKWGKHKSAEREETSADAKRVGDIHGRVATQKSTKMLSNKELQEAINRMNLEQQYSRMSGGLDKTRRQKASKFVADMIANATKQTAQQIVSNEVKTQVQGAVNKARTS